MWFRISGTSEMIPYFEASNPNPNPSPNPDQPYTVWFSFWALPNMTSDRLDDKVPLVPGYLHRLITRKMQCNIMGSKVGEDSKKYVTLLQLYDKEVEDANQTRNFADGDESGWGSSECAVRSTGSPTGANAWGNR